jgi:hypothetical protein
MAPSICWNCRAYAALLLLYPPDLRRQFGAEMVEVFADQMRDACESSGWAGGISVWCCVAGEVVRTMLSSHLRIIGVSLVSGLTAFGLMLTFFWVTFGETVGSK